MNAEKQLIDFISVCEVIVGGKEVMIKTVSSSFKDREDALQHYTALNYGADYFITRNISDYKAISERLPVLTPAVLMESI